MCHPREGGDLKIPNMNNHSETIIACCTPQGSGAIALLRLCGNNVFTLVDRMAQLPSKKTISQHKSHTIAYGNVINKNNRIIDNVLFLIMHGPNTFTGENTVEITCHNNPFIIDAITQTAITHGARLAGPGEFTQRAVLNEKIDIIKAEAINELIHANTQQGLKLSLSQLNGSLSSLIASIEKKLLHALALCQASFEFIEEDRMTFDTQIKNDIVDVQNTISKLQQSFNAQKIIREGIRIALIGSVNAGKSSLFNELIGQDRAIVTNIAGTTRDSIEAGLYQNGTYWTLVDTAGLRQTNNVIEKIGIKRSLEEVKKADIVLLIQDGSCKLTTAEKSIYKKIKQYYSSKIIEITTKSDIATKTNNYENKNIYVSVKKQINIDSVKNAITKKSDKLLQTESPFLLNKRQITLVSKLANHLKIISSLLTDDIAYELVAMELIECISQLSEFTGKTISEQSMDAVFREFCVGK